MSEMYAIRCRFDMLVYLGWPSASHTIIIAQSVPVVLAGMMHAGGDLAYRTRRNRRTAGRSSTESALRRGRAGNWRFRGGISARVSPRAAAVMVVVVGGPCLFVYIRCFVVQVVAAPGVRPWGKIAGTCGSDRERRLYVLYSEFTAVLRRHPTQ
jgi:hypothetical protein